MDEEEKARLQRETAPPPTANTRPPPVTSVPDHHVPVMIWVAADYKAQCAIAGRGGVKGRSADHQYCIRCDDCLGDRHIMFEMWMTGEGDTIASLALHCGGFPEDVWAINVADHPEHKSTRAEKGLCQNTGLGGDNFVDYNNFWSKDGFKLRSGDDGAPPDHTGTPSCKCSFCALPAGVSVRLFRKVKSFEGFLATSLFPIEVRQFTIDVLHALMRITESLLWALICAVCLPPSLHSSFFFPLPHSRVCICVCVHLSMCAPVCVHVFDSGFLWDGAG